MKLLDIEKISQNKLPFWTKFKTPVYILCGLLLVYITIQVSTPKTILYENKDLLNKVDSLEKIALRLEKEQLQEQNRDSIYLQKLSNITIEIGVVRRMSIEIERHYKEELTKARKFTPTEVDSFFKKRYGF